ncbi:uncharacterized protein V1510DRAFT_218444 [Dipodascopsis tothii]|uniref:uncharacterized protein n=1 Tax=Dipodascopsis tothii TaxID=44089 RepID=UPI0034CEEE55
MPPRVGSVNPFWPLGLGLGHVRLRFGLQWPREWSSGTDALLSGRRTLPEARTYITGAGAVFLSVCLHRRTLVMSQVLQSEERSAPVPVTYPSMASSGLSLSPLGAPFLAAPRTLLAPQPLKPRDQAYAFYHDDDDIFSSNKDVLDELVRIVKRTHDRHTPLESPLASPVGSPDNRMPFPSPVSRNTRNPIIFNAAFGEFSAESSRV